MGDLVCREIEAEVCHRTAGERQRFSVVALHPLRRVGKPAAAVEALGIELERIGAGSKAGEAVLDLAALGHAPEHLPLLPAGEEQRGELDEFEMKIVSRNRAPDPIDKGCGRVLLHIAKTFPPPIGVAEMLAIPANNRNKFHIYMISFGIPGLEN